MSKNKNPYFEMILKETNKELGDGILKDGHELLNKQQIIVPISPALDVVCGGVPTGGFTTLYGPPKVGKTITALQLAANAQDIKYKSPGEDEGRYIYYHNIEQRIQPRDVAGISNLNMDRFKWIESKKGNILTAEKHLAQAYREITTHPGCIVIIDSVAALLTESEATKGMDEVQMAAGAKLMAKFCRKVSGAVSVNDCMVICITQLMGNPGMGAGNKEKGGFALGYQVDTKLQATHHTPWKIGGEDSDPIGQIVHWKVINSPIKSPGRKADSYIRYGIGIDKVWELSELAESLGIIDKAGAWYTCKFMQSHVTDYNEKEYKFQGKAKLVDYLNNDKKALDILQKEVGEFYK